jgi:photosystem II stability/assembly factor-like uncharacterized protein
MSSWSLSSSFPNVQSSITAVGTNTTGSIIYAAPAYKKLQKSTDGGLTWTELASTENNTFCYGIVVSADGQTVFYISTSINTKILKSTDGGNTWVTVVSYSDGNINSISGITASSDMSILYYSYQANGIYKSTDSGSTWSSVLTDSDRWRSVSCSADGSVVAAVKGYGETGQVYISVNGGSSWNQYGSNMNYWSVHVSGSGKYIYAVPTSGNIEAFENTAGAISVRSPSPAVGGTDIVTSHDGQIVFVLSNTYIHKSTDAGATFTSENVASGTTVSELSMAASRTADKVYFGGGVMVSYPYFDSKLYSYSGVGSDIQASAAPCFLADARVQTPSGLIAIANLKEGDVVLSAAGGKPVRIQRIVAKQVKPTIQNIPYIIPAGTWGAQVDLPISPDHRVVVPTRGLVKASEMGLDRLVMAEPFTYYNLEVENCENIVVEGVAVESLAHTKQYHLSVAEFGALIARLERSGKGALAAKLMDKARKQGAMVNLPLYLQRK